MGRVGDGEGWRLGDGGDGFWVDVVVGMGVWVYEEVVIGVVILLEVERGVGGG